MAHLQQLQFVKSISRGLIDDYNNIKVIEIGSYEVNDGVRYFFTNSSYVGVDLINGPGVDLVCEGDKVNHPDETYDISLSCECFEHNPNWIKTFENMWRMTKKGGIVIATCATSGRLEHGTSRTSSNQSPGSQMVGWDYYKNLSPADFEKKLPLSDMFSDYFFQINTHSSDLYFFGIRKPENQRNIFKFNFDKLQNQCEQDQLELQSVLRKRKRKEKLIPKILRPLFRRYFKFEKSKNLVEI